MKKTSIFLSALLMLMTVTRAKAQTTITSTDFSLQEPSSSLQAMLSYTVSGTGTVFLTYREATNPSFTGIVPVHTDTLAIIAGSYARSIPVEDTNYEYVQVIGHDTATGTYDTSATLRLKKGPILSFVSSPVSTDIVTVATVSSGNDSAWLYFKLWYGGIGIGSAFLYDSSLILPGSTVVRTSTTPALPTSTLTGVEVYLHASHGSVDQDTSVMTNPALLIPTVDTAAPSFITDTEIVIYGKAIVYGSSDAYTTCYRYGTSGVVIDSQTVALSPIAGNQNSTFDFHPLPAGTVCRFAIKAHNSVNDKWTSQFTYTTLATSPHFTLKIDTFYQDPSSGNIVAKVTATPDPSIGVYDFTVLFAYGTASSIINPISCTGVTTDTTLYITFEVDTAGTYFMYAYGDCGSQVQNTDTLKIGCWPTNVQELTVTPEDAKVIITNAMGQTMDTYSIKGGEKIWKEERRNWPAGIYYAHACTATHQFVQKKVWF